MDERRHSGRKPVNLDAKIIAEGRVFDGCIENMSEDGLEYFMTSFVSASRDFFSNKMITMTFQSPSGEMISLTCELMWFLETSPAEKALFLGMKIVNPSKPFRELVKSMN
ncbi:MAG: PilZ domain-containing protein [Nitrospiraceae bacterium]|nr:MAG: PilZ domain-containing protein [Nitrospiraceae bacterium]